MNDNIDRGLERHEALQERQREAAVARVRSNLAGLGEEFCLTCGERIEEARRAALPSAKRCVGCQTAAEARR
jgi:phage/conjugal plasmid C-4 type zinc finger TraR family protein